jgi:hypothetical protein
LSTDFLFFFFIIIVKENLADTKEVSGSRKSTKDIQWPKEQTMMSKTLRRKLKIEQHEPH